MRTRIAVPCLAASLALGAGFAFAQDSLPTEPTPLDPTMTSVKPSFEALDTNKDGQIEKTEIPIEHELNTLFASFDGDSDLALSRAEFGEYSGEEDEESE